MGIEEEASVVSATLAVSVEPSTAVLSKTKFLLLYRKQCVDKPMMVRLELTECGYEQFRSGMVVDPAKTWTNSPSTSNSCAIGSAYTERSSCASKMRSTRR